MASLQISTVKRQQASLQQCEKFECATTMIRRFVHYYISFVYDNKSSSILLKNLPIRSLNQQTIHRSFYLTNCLPTELKRLSLPKPKSVKQQQTGSKTSKTNATISPSQPFIFLPKVSVID